MKKEKIFKHLKEYQLVILFNLNNPTVSLKTLEHGKGLFDYLIK